MAHLTARSGYESLVDRLNRAPQGAPPSELLHAILKMLFSEKEAGLVALLPIKPFTVSTAAAVWKSARDGSAEGPRGTGQPSDSPRHRGPVRRASLCPATTHGRVLRVLADASAR